MIEEEDDQKEHLINDVDSEVSNPPKKKGEEEKEKMMKTIIFEDELIDDNELEEKKRKETLSYRKSTVIKAVLEMKKSNEWEQFMQTFNKKMDNKQTMKEILKNIFNMKSYFITIWKTSFAFFNVVVIFVYFFHYVFLKLPKGDTEHLPTKVYFFINTMFGFEFCISGLILIFNGGSWLSYVKLPLKLAMLIPFTLHYSNLIYLLIKFARIDRIERLFTFVEKFCNSIINTFVHNYYLKVFMTYLNQLFRYLLIFGLYAHFFACIYAFYTGKAYIESLYYTFETFTTIGYGDPNPENNTARILIIINMFVGVNIFYVITAIIKMIYLKIYGYKRESSFRKHFEFFLYKLQKNTKRVFPDKLKEMVSSYLIFRQGLCFKDLMVKYEDEFKMCRYDVRQEIRQKVFGYWKEQYHIFFKDCSDEFVYRICENMKPKIIQNGQTLIRYGHKVKKMYFLLSGSVFAYDKHNQVVFGLNDCSLFGDWEFINQLVSDVTIKVNPNKSGYGFTLDKETFRAICKDEPESAKLFILRCFYKKQQQREWMAPESALDYNECKTADEQFEFLKRNVSDLEIQLINLKNKLAAEL